MNTPIQSSWLPQTATRLNAGFPEDMVILDCETTGGNARYHRIIEVGLLVIRQGEIIDTWQSFIDPDRPLPATIQNLTGITPKDLKGAPLFADIADVLLSKLQGRVLVAHFARFDYGFIKNEFSRLGISYSNKPLCSVKLSRALFPQFKHHGLDAIIQRFQFHIANRHRAFDDAEIVYQLFLKCSALFDADEVRATCQSIMKRPTLPLKLPSSAIDSLPSQPGVYYFYDDKGVVLYIGKSVNIRTRVLSHFTQDHKNPKDITLSQKVAHIDFKQTAGDFGAQLLESREIKLQSPYYNRRLKKVKHLFQIQIINQPAGVSSVNITKIECDIQNEAQFGLFRSHKQAESALLKLADNYFLCLKKIGLEGKYTENQNRPCFRFQLKKCLGVCCGKESIASHNDRLAQALSIYQLKVWPYPHAIIIEEHNRDTDAKAFHLVDRWRYVSQLSDPSDIYDYGYCLPNNPLPIAINPADQQISNSNCSVFDLDTYFILVRFLLADNQKQSIQIKPLTLVNIEA